MKKTTSFLTKITLGLGIVTILSSLSMAAAPLYINYQGKLTNDRGEPVNEEVSVTFNLWAGPSGGPAILTESAIPITPENGVFTHPISVPADFFSTYPEVYLSVTLGSTELLPRQKLVSVPYAMAVATGSVGTLELANNSVTGDKLAPMTMPIDVVASSIAATVKISPANIKTGPLPTDVVATALASSVKINANQINDGALPYKVIASSVAVDVVESAQIKNGSVTKEKLKGTDYIDVYQTRGDNRLIIGEEFTSGVCKTVDMVKYFSCGGTCNQDKPNSCEKSDAIKIGRLLEYP